MKNIYYKNAVSMANDMKNEFDQYFAGAITEVELMEYVDKSKAGNMEFFQTNGEFTATLKQRMGKKRMRVLAIINERE